MIPLYLARHRKSVVAAIGLVVTLTQQALPHWAGTGAVTAAAAAVTWLLVHEVPNAPATPPEPTPAAIALTLEKIFAELAKPIVPPPAAAAAPSSPTSSPSSSSSSS